MLSGILEVARVTADSSSSASAPNYRCQGDVAELQQTCAPFGSTVEDLALRWISVVGLFLCGARRCNSNLDMWRDAVKELIIEVETANQHLDVAFI